MPGLTLLAPWLAALADLLVRLVIQHRGAGVRLAHSVVLQWVGGQAQGGRGGRASLVGKGVVGEGPSTAQTEGLAFLLVTVLRRRLVSYR